MKKHNKENILIGHLPINDILTWKNNYNKLANDLVKYDRKIDDIYVSDVQDTYIYYNEEHGVYSSPYNIEYALNDEYRGELNNIINIANSYPNDFLKPYLNDYSEDNSNSIDLSKYQFKKPNIIVKCYNHTIPYSEQLSIIRCGDSGMYSLVKKSETNNTVVNQYFEDCIYKYSNMKNNTNIATIRYFLRNNNLQNRFYFVRVDDKTAYIVESILYKSSSVETIYTLDDTSQTLRTLKNLSSEYMEKINKKQYSIMRENIGGQTYYIITTNPNTGFVNHYLDDMIKKYRVEPTSFANIYRLFNAFNVSIEKAGYVLIRDNISCTDNGNVNYYYTIANSSDLIEKNKCLKFSGVSLLKRAMVKDGLINKEYVYIKYNSEYICIPSNEDIPIEYGDDYELVLFDESNKTTTISVSLLKNNNLNLIMKKIK